MLSMLVSCTNPRSNGQKPGSSELWEAVPVDQKRGYFELCKEEVRCVVFYHLPHTYDAPTAERGEELRQVAQRY